MYEKTYHTRVLKTDTRLPKEVQKKSLRRFSWKKFLVVLGLLALLLGVVYALRHKAMQVKDIDVVGATVLDVEDIQIYVRNKLEGKHLWVLPRTSIFLINEKVLEQDLRSAFSRIETVKVKRNSFHSLEILIKEFDAAYLWCAEDIENCYFMDKEGVVYSNAPVFSGTAYPKIISDMKIESLPFQPIPFEEVRRISELKTRLSEIGIVPTVFKFVSSDEMNIDFIHNKTIATLKLDTSTPTETSLEYIFSGIRTEPLSSLLKNPNKNLLYIDVRFPSKVVYKFDESIKIDQ